MTTAGDPSALIPTAEVFIRRAMALSLFKNVRGAVHGETVSTYANALHGEIVVVPEGEAMPCR